MTKGDYSYLSSNTSTTTPLLNSLVFKDISKYLIYKQPFKQLLEISLLSKSSFKIIQCLITYHSFELKLIFGNQFNLKSYINNCKFYKLKLIQFNEIEFLRCISKDEYYDQEDDEEQDDEDDDENKNNRIKFKNYLNENCKNLKRVHLIMSIASTMYCSNDGDYLFFDQTLGGFYSFENLYIPMNQYYPPVSNKLEKELMDSSNSIRNYQFSFKFLKNYQPRKIEIEQTQIFGYDFYGLENLINSSSPSSSSIESIKFFYQTVTPSTIKSILSSSPSSNLKSLTLPYFNKNNHLNFNENDIWNSFKIGLSNNFKLKKLSFQRWSNINDDDDSSDSIIDYYYTSLPYLLNSIIESNNKSLKKLDISAFDLISSDSLSNLFLLPSIIQLSYIFIPIQSSSSSSSTMYYYSTPIEIFFNHFLNKFSNILIFKSTFIINNNQQSLYIQNQFLKFFTNYNKSSKFGLKIKLISQNNNFNDKEIKLNLIKNCKNNEQINLSFF